MLSRELQAQGYCGSERAVYRSLSLLVAPAVLPTMVPLLSSKRASWLFVKQPTELDEEEPDELSLLREGSATAERVYHLVQAFGQMVRLRQGERLDAWLQAVNGSALPELQAFAEGIQRDKAAVQAGLTLYPIAMACWKVTSID
ncbi:MAG: hypothetical protein NVS2B2_34700 [Ktedonobacteraceae bacterium]